MHAHAGARRPVKRLNQAVVHQRVHLGADGRRLSLLRASRLSFNQLHDPLAHVRGRHHQLPHPRWVGKPRQRIEKRRGVHANLWRRGEQAEIRIQPCRAVVVVARAEVHVAADAPWRAPHHQTDLRVHLQSANAIDDVCAGFLERARPLDVPLFVKAGHQLDDHRHLFALDGRPLQRLDDRRVRTWPVQRLLDGEHLRIIGRLLDQGHNRIEAVVRVVQQEVALVEDIEDVRLLLGGQRGYRLL